MKTLSALVLVLALSCPAFAWDDDNGRRTRVWINDRNQNDVFIQQRNGAWSVDKQRFLPKAGRGVVDPQTGTYYPKVGGGYIDPQTGQFHPN